MKTKKEVVAWMRSQGMSGVSIVRIEKLMDQFATPEAFFQADRINIEKAYRKISQDNKHGIGNKFWETFDKVLRFWKTKEEPANKEDESSEPPQENANQPIDMRLIRMIPVNEVKAVAAMMELLDIEAINLLEIMGFLSNVRFRQKKNDDAKANEKKPDAEKPEEKKEGAANANS